MKLEKVVTFVPTANAERAREFYERTLGLKFVSDDQFALVFDLSGTMLRIARAGDYKPAPFTILGWEVKQISAIAAGLRERGVKFERFPGMEQDELGIWNAPGGDRVAWFKDPDGNILSISEHVGR